MFIPHAPFQRKPFVLSIFLKGKVWKGFSAREIVFLIISRETRKVFVFLNMLPYLDKDPAKNTEKEWSKK